MLSRRWHLNLSPSPQLYKYEICNDSSAKCYLPRRLARVHHTFVKDRPCARCYSQTRRLLSVQSSKKTKFLVALVGWLGAQERHIKKYASLWEGLGHDTFSVRPRTSSIVIPALGDLQARSFLQHLRAEQARRPHHRLLIQIFSNAGFLFLGTAFRLLALGVEGTRTAHTSLAGSTAGIVLDSAPALLTPDIAARGFVAAALKRPAAGVEQSHPRLVSAAERMFHPLLSSQSISRRSEEVWAAWQTAAPTCPQLYLHSAADVLIPSQGITAFRLRQESRGVTTREKVWADSPHCEHFRVHPEEYRAELADFVSSLQGNGPC